MFCRYILLRWMGYSIRSPWYEWKHITWRWQEPLQVSLITPSPAQSWNNLRAPGCTHPPVGMSSLTCPCVRRMCRVAARSPHHCLPMVHFPTSQSSGNFVLGHPSPTEIFFLKSCSNIFWWKSVVSWHLGLFLLQDGIVFN